MRATKRNEVPEGWPGQLLSLAEWEENIANKQPLATLNPSAPRAGHRLTRAGANRERRSYNLTEQAAKLSGWLGQIDPLIKERLLPLLRSKEPFVEVEQIEKEGEELLKEDASTLSEEAVLTDEERQMRAAKEGEEEEEDDVEDEDDVEEEPEDIPRDIDESKAEL